MGDGCVRCILHLDLDCFYAAVEHKRLGLPPETAVAVQQWGGLIAVNCAFSHVFCFTYVLAVRKTCVDIYYRINIAYCIFARYMLLRLRYTQVMGAAWLCGRSRSWPLYRPCSRFRHQAQHVSV